MLETPEPQPEEGEMMSETLNGAGLQAAMKALRLQQEIEYADTVGNRKAFERDASEIVSAYLAATPPAPADAALLAQIDELLAAAQFLVDRLDDFDSDWNDVEEQYREFAGHVSPAIGRLRPILEAARAALASPVGGEPVRYIHTTGGMQEHPVGNWVKYPAPATLDPATLEAAAREIRRLRKLLHEQFEAHIEREDGIYDICEKAVLNLGRPQP